MKVAVSSNGKSLDANLDPRLGRCAFFLVINPDDMSFEAIENDGAFQGGGAGIQSAQLLCSKGVDIVITGNCGPKAVQTLAAAGVDLYTGQAGAVKDVVKRFKEGNLRSTTEATVDSHYGMGDGTGTDRRSGMGRGMGRGRSKGFGMGMPVSKAAKKKGSVHQSNDQELEDLKQQASRLNDRMKEVIFRINSLTTSGRR